VDGDGYFAEADPNDAVANVIPAPNGGFDAAYQTDSVSCEVTAGQVLINEVFPSPSNNGTEWMELYNATGSAVNIGNCYVDDMTGASPPYQIPPSTVIPAHGFWTLDQISYFNNAGDDVRFLKEDLNTLLDSFTYGNTANNLSWYRLPDGGSWATMPSASITKGYSNAVSSPPTTLVNSLLPTSRSVQVATTATVFNTVLNGGTTTASGVTLSMANPPTGTFTYQESNCATNSLLGAMNPVLDIPAGQAKCYVLFFTPSAAFASTDVHIRAQASNAPATTLLPGINTWTLRATSSAGPDIIALTTTTDFHQIACNGTKPFAVAMSNVGAATSQVTVTADTGSVSLPLSILIQESDPATGVIIGDNILQNVGAGENRTVVVWVTFNGCTSFDPATHRIFIRFKDVGNNLIGSTSTAVSTNR
jgi:hypothetical protein